MGDAVIRFSVVYERVGAFETTGRRRFHVLAPVVERDRDGFARLVDVIIIVHDIVDIVFVVVLLGDSTDRVVAVAHTSCANEAIIRRIRQRRRRFDDDD